MSWINLFLLVTILTPFALPKLEPPPPPLENFWVCRCQSQPIQLYLYRFTKNKVDQEELTTNFIYVHHLPSHKLY